MNNITIPNVRSVFMFTKVVECLNHSEIKMEKIKNKKGFLSSFYGTLEVKKFASLAQGLPKGIFSPCKR